MLLSVPHSRSDRSEPMRARGLQHVTRSGVSAQHSTRVARWCGLMARAKRINVAERRGIFEIRAISPYSSIPSAIDVYNASLVVLTFLKASPEEFAFCTSPVKLLYSNNKVSRIWVSPRTSECLFEDYRRQQRDHDCPFLPTQCVAYLMMRSTSRVSVNFVCDIHVDSCEHAFYK